LAEVRWVKSVGPAEITKISVGRMDNNVYVIAVGDRAFVVDGGSAELDAVLSTVGGRTIEGVLQTHNHGDHTTTLKEFVETTSAPVFAHPDDKLPVRAIALKDGGEAKIGDLSLKVLHTPGHTPGGVCFLLQVDGESHLFAGDTLFPGGPGNTSGDEKRFAQIMKVLEEKLFTLPDETHVYPGHGSDTTIGTERPNLEEWRARGW
jgi:glyoxylase-like metal-dependent hydrolase (beta-lactamase superfamily II)